MTEQEIRKIVTCFETITPESAAEGDFEETGFDDETELTQDEISWQQEFDELETQQEAIVKLALKLMNDGQGLEPSSSQFHSGVWYTEIDCNKDRTYFETGAETRFSYHLKGFTIAEEQAIFDAVKRIR